LSRQLGILNFITLLACVTRQETNRQTDRQLDRQTESQLKEWAVLLEKEWEEGI